MKLLLAALLATTVLAINEDEISHALRSMREEISELKTQYKQLKAENRALGAENKAIGAENRALRSDVDVLKSQRMPEAPNNESTPDPLRNESTAETSSKQLQTTGDLAGEIRFFGLENCPFGWEEVNSTRGYMIVSRPAGAKSMQYFGKPLKSGETSRAGAPHTHKTTVTDPGHR
jgi:regulator of replication initiation timing